MISMSRNDQNHELYTIKRNQTWGHLAIILLKPLTLKNRNEPL